MFFKDLKGQDQAVDTLKSYIRQGHLSGGFIFSGPEGVGKKMAALASAMRLNCVETSADEPCGHCASCLKIGNLTHPDLHLIGNQDGEIKIEDVRSLQRQISFRPYEGLMQVFIIDNSHRLNPESSNALLKVLEEPPKHNLIILVTSKPRVLFNTISSRCKVVRFYALPRHDLERILSDDYSCDPQSAHFLAYFAEGSLGEALKFSQEQVMQRKNSLLDDFVFSAKPGLGFSGIQSKEEMRFSLNLLATAFRDIYLVKVGALPEEMINLDRKEELFKVADRLSFTRIDGILGCISESIEYLESNINIRLLLNNLGAQLWQT